jgi:hypothetical protein
VKKGSSIIGFLVIIFACNFGYASVFFSKRDFLTFQKSASSDTLLPYFQKIPEITPSLSQHSLLKKSNNLPAKQDFLFFRGRAGNFVTKNLLSFLWNNADSAKNLVEVNSSFYFELYAGKRISSIRFQQLDVFGPTLQDTNLVSDSWLSRTGNSIHVKTIESKLRKQLLFSVGELVQPTLMAENEKIFRDLPYIRDVAIILTPSTSSDNEVDALILIKERFEYGFAVDVDMPRTEIEVYDDNMFGLGHQFIVKAVHHQTAQPNWGGEIDYLFNNFGGKFINGGITLLNTFRKSGVSTKIERNFISSEIKNAGGISFQRITRDYYNTPYYITKSDTAESYLNTDLWFGHSFIHENSGSSLGIPVLSGRYFHQNFFGPFNFTNRGMIRNHDFFVTSLGFSKRNLFKNNLVYGYGITEDIPYGRYFEIATGLDLQKKDNRLYSHFIFSQANILSGGRYIGGTFGIGGYLKRSSVEQGILKLDLNYFSRLSYTNRNPYRNFINLEFLSGINRFWDEYLSINRYYGLRDFRSLDVRGTSRLKINIESVHFLRLNYHGFRFAQYFYGDCAFISNKLASLFQENFYTGVGIGLRVHNESLVFKVFELRLSWFPIVPNDQNILKFKIFTQSKSTFEDFLGRKPQEITFQ